MSLRRLSFGGAAAITVLLVAFGFSGSARSQAASLDQRCGLLEDSNLCTSFSECWCYEGDCQYYLYPKQIVQHYVSGSGFKIYDTQAPCFEEWNCIPLVGLECTTNSSCKRGIILLNTWTYDALTYGPNPEPCS